MGYTGGSSATSITGRTGNTTYKSYTEVIVAGTGYGDNDYDINTDLGGEDAQAGSIVTDQPITIRFNGDVGNEISLLAGEVFDLEVGDLVVSRVQMINTISGGTGPRLPSCRLKGSVTVCCARTTCCPTAGTVPSTSMWNRRCSPGLRLGTISSSMTACGFSFSREPKDTWPSVA